MSAQETPPKIAYAIFDMDGLLIDTETIYTSVTQEILKRFDLQMSMETKSGLMGMPSLKAAEHLFASFPPGSLPADYTPELYLKEREALQDAAFRVVKPLPGAVELVERLKASGIPLALATGSSDAAFKIKTSHLTSLFSSFGPHVITASSPPVPPQTTPSRGKPFPDPYLSAARSLGFNVGTEEEPASEEERLERAKGLVFEDAVPGVRAGLRAGMNVVWVPDLEIKALHPNLGAHHSAESLEGFDLSRWGL